MHTDSSGGIAADRREQQQMRKKAVKNAGMIRIYLNMAWKLLQKNLLSIVIFETVYRLFSNRLVSRLANAAINFSLKQLGTSYMTSENFNKIMLHPLTLLLILGILLVFFFCMLFEIYAVMAALEASWKRKRISVPVMMLAGGRGAAQFVRARPWTCELPVPLAAQQLQRHPQYETASGFPDEDFQCLPGILDPGGADDSACRVLVCVFLHHPVPVHDDGKREKYPSAGAPDTGKTRAA